MHSSSRNKGRLFSSLLGVTRAGHLSHWKGLAFPNTADCCTRVVFLAKNGITGPLEVMEGDKGFMDAISGVFDIELYCLEPGASVSPHRHQLTEHVLTVVAGEARIRIGSQWITARRNETALIPAGLYHSLPNAGVERLIVQQVSGPKPWDALSRTASEYLEKRVHEWWMTEHSREQVRRGVARLGCTGNS